MKNKFLNLTALMLALCLMLSMTACGNDAPEVPTASAAEIYSSLLNHVQYDTDLSDNSESAAIMYAGLPEGAVVTMYSGDARYADELTWIALAQESDFDAAMDVVDTHIDEKHDQYLSYHAEEVPKIDGALVWSDSTNIILCITADYDNAKALADGSASRPSNGSSDAVETEDPTEPVEDPTEPQPTEPPVVAYPTITTEDTWHKYDVCMVVDNMAYEYYSYSEAAAKNYAALVSSVAQALEGEVTVYDLIIPTAVGVVFPDNLAAQYSGYEDQAQRLEEIYAMMDDSVVQVNIFDKLMQHRDEYLYYRTDWHWSAIGAYYGYERFCEVKGITPYTMKQRTEHVYEGYLGPFAKYSSAVSNTPDTVYAYDPYFDVSMVFTDASGNDIAWPVIADGDTYGAGSKYLIFAAGDQPIAEFTNPGVTDGSVAIVVKESFGNAMMPYFPDHYSTVYEVDYRYWNGDLVEFARQVGAEDIIFANNIGMVRSSYLIGLMDKIIP